MHFNGMVVLDSIPINLALYRIVSLYITVKQFYLTGYYARMVKHTDLVGIKTGSCRIVSIWFDPLPCPGKPTKMVGIRIV